MKAKLFTDLKAYKALFYLFEEMYFQIMHNRNPHTSRMFQAGEYFMVGTGLAP